MIYFSIYLFILITHSLPQWSSTELNIGHTFIKVNNIRIALNYRGCCLIFCRWKGQTALKEEETLHSTQWTHDRDETAVCCWGTDTHCRAGPALNSMQRTRLFVGRVRISDHVVWYHGMVSRKKIEFVEPPWHHRGKRELVKQIPHDPEQWRSELDIRR